MHLDFSLLSSVIPADGTNDRVSCSPLGCDGNSRLEALAIFDLDGGCFTLLLQEVVLKSEALIVLSDMCLEFDVERLLTLIDRIGQGREIKPSLRAVGR